MIGHAHEGVVPCLPALVEERPIAGLERRAARARARSARSGARFAPRARAPAAARAGARPRPGRTPPASPRSRGPCARPSSSVDGPRFGLGPLQRVRQGHELDPVRLGRRDDLGEPLRPLPPPVAEELGVDREDDEALRAGSLAMPREALRDRCEELARLLARALAPGLGVADLAPDRPDPGAAEGLAVKVRVDGIRRIAVERPEPGDRLPVDRERDRPRLGRNRAQRRERAPRARTDRRRSG